MSYQTARLAYRAAMRDRSIHYQVSAAAMACSKTADFRLATYEPVSVTCKTCRRTLSQNPAWRRDAGGRETRQYERPHVTMHDPHYCGQCAEEEYR